jgi:hypothetical protein
MQSIQLAHVKWFTPLSKTQVPPLGLVEWLGITGFIVLCLIIVFFADRSTRRFNKYLDHLLGGFKSYVPAIIGITAGAGLILNGLNNSVLAPNISVSHPLIFQFAVGLEIIIGSFWILGIWTRAASLVFLLFFGILFLFAPCIELLEHLEYVGVAVYFLFVGRSTLALMPNYAASLAQQQKGLRSFMVASGLSLVILALSEKLLNMGLAHTFLQSHPWNFVHSLGVSDRLFIVTIGATELVLGLMLVFSLAPKLAVMALLGAMTSTSLFLGTHEVAGHLYAIGLVIAVLVGNQESQR